MNMKTNAGIRLVVSLLLVLLAGTTLCAESSGPLTADERDLATRINHIFRRAVEQVSPAVVSIQAYKLDTPSGPGFFWGPNGPKFQEPDGREREMNLGLGSGCIIDNRGYIITNNHVVADTEKVRVILADGRQFLATEKYFDPDTDLAVVKIDPCDPLTHKELAETELPVARWGDSGQLQVGDMVLAMGNPFGLEQTITSGIVSYLGRQTRILGKWGFEDFIQTDAAINKGNSGGPLVNLYGEVVGVNSNIMTPSGVSAGYGFSIPSRIARKVADQLIEHKQMVRGWLGVKMISLDDARAIPGDEFSRVLDHSLAEVLQRIPETVNGIWVTEVLADSPAAKGGMQDHDVIVKLEGESMIDSKTFRGRIASLPPGKEVRLELWRDGETESLEIALGNRLAAQQEEEQKQQTVRRERRIPNLEDWLKPPDTNYPDTPREPVKLGVIVRSLTEETAIQYGYEKDTQGIVITHVYPNTVAEESGLKVGDIILEVDGKKVGSTQELKEIISESDLANEGVKIKIRNHQGTQVRVIRRGAI